jgi:6-phosphogluconolactonase
MKNGALRLLDVQPDPQIIGKNPTYVVFHPTVPVFYCTNEDAENGDIRAIQFDPKTFACSLINVESARGGAPCHLTISSCGKWLFSATYVGHSTLMYPIAKNGKLGGCSQ